MDPMIDMDITMLIVGAVGGAVFAAIAFAFERRTRQILVRGLIVAAFFYVVFALRAHAGPAWLAIELGGVAVYGAIAWRGLSGSPWWLVAGWALHPIWDIVVHLIGPGRAVAPSEYAVACLTWDPVVALAIAVSILRHSRRLTTRPIDPPAIAPMSR
jgi:hypothetical protein